MSIVYKNKRAPENGSALVYILIAIALLAALTFTFMEPSSQQTSSQNTFKTQTALQGQIDMIRSAVQECVLSYPKGDKTIDTSGSGSDPGARDNYPINPDSTHYTAATPGRSGDRLVKNIRCPGNNPGEQIKRITNLFFLRVPGNIYRPLLIYLMIGSIITVTMEFSSGRKRIKPMLLLPQLWKNSTIVFQSVRRM